jgi:hypothetical protein
MNRTKLSRRLSVTLVATLCVLPIVGKALADVSMDCRHNGVCGCSVFDAQRVNIYLATKKLSGVTHYNFKTNPGAQIELTNGYYSFKPNPGAKGTYSVQACRRGGVGQRSGCTTWETFAWNSSRGEHYAGCP